MLLAGERRMLTMPGFDLGNSPRRVHARGRRRKDGAADDDERHAGAARVQGARDVVMASYVNYTAVCAMLRAALRGGTDITIVCAGQDRQFALEDAACAGRYVNRCVEADCRASELNDAAQACVADRPEVRRQAACGSSTPRRTAGRCRDAGFGEDLAACAAVDSYPVIPIYQDRQITKLGPDRER